MQIFIGMFTSCLGEVGTLMCPGPVFIPIFLSITTESARQWISYTTMHRWVALYHFVLM